MCPPLVVGCDDVKAFGLKRMVVGVLTPINVDLRAVLKSHNCWIGLGEKAPLDLFPIVKNPYADRSDFLRVSYVIDDVRSGLRCKPSSVHTLVSRGRSGHTRHRQYGHPRSESNRPSTKKTSTRETHLFQHTVFQKLIDSLGRLDINGLAFAQLHDEISCNPREN